MLGSFGIAIRLFGVGARLFTLVRVMLAVGSGV